MVPINKDKIKNTIIFILYYNADAIHIHCVLRFMCNLKVQLFFNNFYKINKIKLNFHGIVAFLCNNC